MMLSEGGNMRNFLEIRSDVKAKSCSYQLRNEQAISARAHSTIYYEHLLFNFKVYTWEISVHEFFPSNLWLVPG